MPVHDWHRAFDGLFHDFHQAWVCRIRDYLNVEGLPESHYGLIERASESDANLRSRTDCADIEVYAFRANRIVLYTRDGDTVVAYVEIVSAGNKHNLREMSAFLKKVRDALDAGLHLLIIDLHTPTSRDPRGLHDAIWRDWYGEIETPGTTPEKPFTLVSYVADYIPRAYFEPVGIGDSLKPMPLFLTTELYVNAPLEETYQEAWRGVPRHWKGVIEGGNRD